MMKAPTAVVEATQWEKDKWASWRSSEEWATDAAKNSTTLIELATK